MAFKEINANVSNVTIKALCRHTWHISEELIALSLYGDRVYPSTKSEMVMKMRSNQATTIPIKRPQININHIESLTLVDFVTSNTIRFFDILGIASEWLDKDPDL